MTPIPIGTTSDHPAGGIVPGPGDSMSYGSGSASRPLHRPGPWARWLVGPLARSSPSFSTNEPTSQRANAPGAWHLRRGRGSCQARRHPAGGIAPGPGDSMSYRSGSASRPLHRPGPRARWLAGPLARSIHSISTNEPTSQRANAPGAWHLRRGRGSCQARRHPTTDRPSDETGSPLCPCLRRSPDRHFAETDREGGRGASPPAGCARRRPCDARVRHAHVTVVDGVDAGAESRRHQPT